MIKHIKTGEVYYSRTKKEYLHIGHTTRSDKDRYYYKFKKDKEPHKFLGSDNTATEDEITSYMNSRDHSICKKPEYIEGEKKSNNLFDLDDL